MERVGGTLPASVCPRHPSSASAHWLLGGSAKCADLDPPQLPLLSEVRASGYAHSLPPKQKQVRPVAEWVTLPTTGWSPAMPTGSRPKGTFSSQLFCNEEASWSPSIFILCLFLPDSDLRKRRWEIRIVPYLPFLKLHPDPSFCWVVTCDHTTWRKHRPRKGLPPGPSTRSAYLAALACWGSVCTQVQMETLCCRCALGTIPRTLPSALVSCVVSYLYIT